MVHMFKKKPPNHVHSRKQDMPSKHNLLWVDCFTSVLPQVTAPLISLSQCLVLLSDSSCFSCLEETTGLLKMPQKDIRNINGELHRYHRYNIVSLACVGKMERFSCQNLFSVLTKCPRESPIVQKGYETKKIGTHRPVPQTKHAVEGLASGLKWQLTLWSPSGTPYFYCEKGMSAAM